MKRTLLTLLSVLFCAITFAQSVPQGINYQAVARNASGTVLMNQDFNNGFQFNYNNNFNFNVRAVRAF
jgi:hypothetical protein